MATMDMELKVMQRVLKTIEALPTLNDRLNVLEYLAQRARRELFAEHVRGGRPVVTDTQTTGMPDRLQLADSPS